jgi:uncharacterized protein (TIGR02145 family)
MYRIALSLFALCLYLNPGLVAQNTDFLVDDRDGNVYLVAKFNDTWWMCQNLKYDVGDGSACYDEDETNCMLSGRLYTWEAARKACPEGYHLPSDEEWKALEYYIGMDKEELDKKQGRTSGTVGKFLRSGGGLGFDAEFVGLMNPRRNSYYEGNRAYFWTSGEDENGMGWARILDRNHEGVDRDALMKEHFLAVRCIKAAEPEASEPDAEEVDAPGSK